MTVHAPRQGYLFAALDVLVHTVPKQGPRHVSQNKNAIESKQEQRKLDLLEPKWLSSYHRPRRLLQSRRYQYWREYWGRVLVAGSTQEARHFGSSVFLYAPVDASHRLSQVIAYLISLPSCSFVLCLCHSWFSSLSKGQRQSQRQSLGEKSVLLLLMRDDV